MTANPLKAAEADQVFVAALSDGWDQSLTCAAAEEHGQFLVGDVTYWLSVGFRFHRPLVCPCRVVRDRQLPKRFPQPWRPRIVPASADAQPRPARRHWCNSQGPGGQSRPHETPQAISGQRRAAQAVSCRHRIAGGQQNIADHLGPIGAVFLERLPLHCRDTSTRRPPTPSHSR